MAGELPGRPFAIQHTWVVGGFGDWDYLTLDANARQLFIAHGPTVQVVDLDTGSVVGEVGGLRDAHAVALDNTDGYGYVTDGGADDVKVFDRGTFQVVASIPTGPQPHSLVLEPSSGLLLAICGAPTSDLEPDNTSTNAKPQHGRQAPQSRRTPARIPATGPLSTITVIDPQTRQAMAHIVVAGKLDFAQTDEDGHVYVSEESGNRIESFDVAAMANAIRQDKEQAAAKGDQTPAEANNPLKLNWSGYGPEKPPADVVPRTMRVGGGCEEPHGIAVDRHNYRLFVACANQKMAVLDSQSGANVTSLTIGPGADAIAYDASRGLIFTANGGGYGSVTVIQQHITDDYAVIQNLPTLAKARTLAVDPSTGEVYLVTSLYGAPLGAMPANGIGTLKIDPVNGSFRVLVIGR